MGTISLTCGPVTDEDKLSSTFFLTIIIVGICKIIFMSLHFVIASVGNQEI